MTLNEYILCFVHAKRQVDNEIVFCIAGMENQGGYIAFCLKLLCSWNWILNILICLFYADIEKQEDKIPVYFIAAAPYWQGEVLHYLHLERLFTKHGVYWVHNINFYTKLFHGLLILNKNIECLFVHENTVLWHFWWRIGWHFWCLYEI